MAAEQRSRTGHAHWLRRRDLKMDHDLSLDCTRITRRLHAWEIQEARRIFGTRLDYEAVRIHECAGWPDALDRAGRRLKRMPPPSVPNAVTLGNSCYFPVHLPEVLLLPAHVEFFKIPWLMHELAHTWQYQRYGWIYLAKAIAAQVRGGSKAYEFGGEEGLRKALEQGCKFSDFGFEQQGEFCRAYYYRLAHKKDITAWQPFVEEIQRDRNNVA